MRLKELKIFVEENKDHPKFKSKIGWRATYDGKLYGDQLYTTPSEAKLVEVINLFLGQAIGVIEVLENESSADVVEVRHGEWVNKGDYAVCTECGERSGTQYDGVEPIPLMTKFCSNCGAKMDGTPKERGGEK